MAQRSLGSLASQSLRLGAKIYIRAAFTDRNLLLLAGLLGVAAILTHPVNIVSHKFVSLSVTASAQLGVPVAAVMIGQNTGVLNTGERGAIMASSPGYPPRRV